MLARAPLDRSRCILGTATSQHPWLRQQVNPFSNASHSKRGLRRGPLASQWRNRISYPPLANRRAFLSETAQTILTPPLVFAGLLLTLWTYKCIMMVLFQDKIIYMPNMPPFSRSEKVDDYAMECRPVAWEEMHIKSFDGTRIALCIGTIPKADVHSEDGGKRGQSRGRDVIICYFQGNGSSTPPRLPVLSNILKLLHADSSRCGHTTRYTLIALSYRGYWTSSGRARQSGIELDAQALLNYVAMTFSRTTGDVAIILWGQSVDSGIATTAAARYATHQQPNEPPITGLVLETPFSGIKSMLIALYPQKWLPYRYLWPFLWNQWDSEVALRHLSSFSQRPRILLLPATRDEVVPAEEVDKLEKICKDVNFQYERKDVLGALHNEATVRRDGQRSIAKFIADTVKRAIIISHVVISHASVSVSLSFLPNWM